MNLDAINSATKYPSILTYHRMGERGKLQDVVQVPFDAPAVITEKIDGVNGRIIVFPSGLYIIGSREELLYGAGDLIGNPQLGIADVLRPIADEIRPKAELTVYYFEVFGGSTTKNSKQYTGDKKTGYRLFDVAVIPEKILEISVEKIATWRETGGQRFCSERDLSSMGIPLTPRISIESVPDSLTAAHEWMKAVIQRSRVTLDEGAGGRPEGVVIRLPDRSKIAKMRFQDYERAMKREGSS